MNSQLPAGTGQRSRRALPGGVSEVNSLRVRANAAAHCARLHW